MKLITSSKKKKNIAIIISSHGRGGAERAVQLLSEHLKRRGNNVFYFVPRNSFKDIYLSGKIIDIDLDFSDVDLSYSRGRIRFWKTVFHTASVIRKVKKKYSIEYAISFMEDSNFVNIISRGREKVLVSVRTTLSSRDELKGIFYDRKLIGRLYNWADSVVAVSDYTKKDLVQFYNIHRKKITVIPNVAYYRERKELTKKWDYGEHCIVSIGRLDPVKQHDRIIRAFTVVKESCNDAKLLLLGTGVIEDYLKWIARKMGVENSVIFIGFTDDVGYYLKYARAFVMASKAEGFPNAMVEAMAYGVPVVSMNSPGGCQDILNKKSRENDLEYCEYGILTPYVSGKAPNCVKLENEELILGDTLRRVVSDDDLHSLYSKQAKKRASEYSMDSVMKRWNMMLE